MLTVAALLAAQLAYTALLPGAPRHRCADPGQRRRVRLHRRRRLQRHHCNERRRRARRPRHAPPSAAPPITPTSITTLPDGQLAPDALALTADGTAAYTVQATASGATVPLYRYDALTQSWATYAGTATDGDHLVAGAIDPHSGIYYYASLDAAAGSATVYGFDPATHTAIPGVLATVALPLTGSGTAGGDLAFDRDGNLYLAESLGAAAALTIVDGPLPTANDGSADGTALSGRATRALADPAAAHLRRHRVRQQRRALRAVRIEHRHPPRRARPEHRRPARRRHGREPGRRQSRAPTSPAAR